jgi:hypothetical protein
MRASRANLLAFACFARAKISVGGPINLGKKGRGGGGKKAQKIRQGRCRGGLPEKMLIGVQDSKGPSHK